VKRGPADGVFAERRPTEAAHPHVIPRSEDEPDDKKRDRGRAEGVDGHARQQCGGQAGREEQCGDENGVDGCGSKRLQAPSLDPGRARWRRRHWFGRAHDAASASKRIDRVFDARQEATAAGDHLVGIESVRRGKRSNSSARVDSGRQIAETPFFDRADVMDAQARARRERREVLAAPGSSAPEQFLRSGGCHRSAYRHRARNASLSHIHAFGSP
jgi:hypothetical protein